MPNIHPVKGTHDVVGWDAELYAYIEDTFFSLSSTYGYARIETPVVEHTEVFSRDANESSDMVRKEMYTFLDKSERSLTLRPEGTAGVMRSIVTNKLYANADLPLKYAYCGTAYRYERPQLGRYREFRQMGVECVGEDSYYLDAETIALAYEILHDLGFENMRLKINTLGDKASRLAYKEALRSFFATKIDDMCEDCKERLRLNPMRILDCKVPADQEIVKTAPKMSDYLSPESKARFDATLDLLREKGIPFEVDETLVRGLDYYGEVVFEVHCLSPEGKDYGAICGGGHYEGILQSLGGPQEVDVGVGFGMGVERVASLMWDLSLCEDVTDAIDVYVMPMDPSSLKGAWLLTGKIRDTGISALCQYKASKIGAMFKRAERKKCKFAVLYGSSEAERGVAQIKDLDSQEQIEVPLDEVPERLVALLAKKEYEDEE